MGLRQRDQRRLERQLELYSRVRSFLPSDIPYLGHLRIRRDGEVADVLLGAESRVIPGGCVLDWTRAPLARAFFSVREGERFRVGRENPVECQLLERNLVRFSAGALVEVIGERVAISRGRSGEWAARSPSRFDPRDSERRRPRSPQQLAVTLDRRQAHLAARSLERSMVILGPAGVGKTTMALHRLLQYRRSAGAGLRAAVVVPTEGLRALSERFLARAGALDIETWTHDRWAARQARRAFPGLPGRESARASSAVISVKRHRALREVLERFVRRSPGLGTWAPRPPRARRRDLLELFGDGTMLAPLLTSSGGAITGAMLAEVLDHTRVQFTRTTEDQNRHVDRERLVTLDDRAIDDGTPGEDASTIDPEDYAVLFEIDRLRSLSASRRPARPRGYDVILIDEAQELAPLELALLGRSLSPAGTMIVTGDEGQQGDPTACFVDWATAARDLRLSRALTVRLEKSYRCPDALARVARRLLEPGSAIDLPSRAVLGVRLASALHRASWLIEALRAVLARDPGASIGVICRTPELAGGLDAQLLRALDVGVLAGDSSPVERRVQVTCAAQARGIEFDYVFIADADAATYPDSPEARRHLYVALTRARRRVVLLAVGAWSSLIRCRVTDQRFDSTDGSWASS